MCLTSVATVITVVVARLSPTLKVLNSFKGKSISNPPHTVSANGMKIATIGKDSVPVSIMNIAPANDLIHRKAASFDHLVRKVSTIKVLHTFSELIYFKI